MQRGSILGIVHSSEQIDDAGADTVFGEVGLDQFQVGGSPRVRREECEGVGIRVRR